MSCKRNFFCRYALGAPIVGEDAVIYNLRTCLERLLQQDLFILTVPVTTTSALPARVQLCDGNVLNVVFSSTSDPAAASSLIGQRAYLGTILCVGGVPTLNILNAPAPTAAAG